MSLLFSQVTLSTEDDDVSFFVGGIPRDEDDLKGWTAYDDFVDGIDSDTEIQVHVETYLYGCSESVKASPEEIAYFIGRMDFDETFLDDHCDNIEDSAFTISYSPCNLFGCDFLNCKLKGVKKHECT